MRPADTRFLMASVSSTCVLALLSAASLIVRPTDALNGATRQWLLGELPPRAFPRSLMVEDGPVWGRALSSGVPSSPDCEALRATLERLGAARLVVGHTPQRLINAACCGLVWRCDTGMSRYVIGGAREALEISAEGTVRVLSSSGRATPAVERTIGLSTAKS